MRARDLRPGWTGTCGDCGRGLSLKFTNGRVRPDWPWIETTDELGGEIVGVYCQRCGARRFEHGAAA